MLGKQQLFLMICHSQQEPSTDLKHNGSVTVLKFLTLFTIIFGLNVAFYAVVP